MVSAVRTLLCSSLMVSLGTVASAQAHPGKGAPPDAASRSLLTLEDAWAAGMVARDGALFRRLLAPGFVYTENDQVASRADVLKGMVSGPDTVTAAHNEGMAVHLFRPVGVVTGWLIVQGRGKDGSFEHRYRFTDTWLERNGVWQIVAAQDYLKPRPQQP